MLYDGLGAGGTASQSVTIKRDTTPPVAHATPAPVPNVNGWHNANVTVKFTGADATSGIANCSSDALVGSEAANQSSPPGTCTDNAGNVASPSVTFSIIVTAASIMDEVRYFLSTGDITVNNEANSLLQKLNAGAAYRAAGDCKDANQVYQSFISELVAQSGKKVSKTSAAILIADAQYLIAHCP